MLRKKMATYDIYPAPAKPEFKGLWDGPVWKNVMMLDIGHFRPESSDHRPTTKAKLLYGYDALYGLFRVEDRFVRCVHRRHQDPVYKDSCVEFFIKPPAGEGYFNFEFNCGGALLSSYVMDPMRSDDGFAAFHRLSKSDVRDISIFHSQPRVVEPEVEDPLTWHLEFGIPYRLLEKYAGRVDISNAEPWSGNLYKCGDDTSHPHWAAWSPVDELNFHLPRCFGKFVFVPPYLPPGASDSD